jgi:serine/threonine protein kinase
MSTNTRLEDRYDFVRDVAKGGEGEVKEYARKDTGTLVAVKFRKRKDRGRPREVEVLQSFSRNSLIVGFVECFDINFQDCAIVLEHCPGGDLYDFYRRQEQSDIKFAFSELFLWSVFEQLSDALAFIHRGISRGGKTQQPVVHCDIKPHNILIKSLGTKGDFSSIRIKLADFGLAIFYDPNNRHQRIFGSTAYYPPGMSWEDPRYTPAFDIWGMGAVMHFLAHGYPPLENPRDAAKRRTEDDSRASPAMRELFFSMGYSESDWHNMNAKRVVVPINLEPDSHTLDPRMKRPTPKYSDALNYCFSMALMMDAQARPEASVIAKKVKRLGPSPWWSALLNKVRL